MNESAGGRIFFSSSGRSLSEEDQISILTVGIDIGSSTSHLVFSRIVMERLDSRYVVAARVTLYESPILLTPYAAENSIDGTRLGEFIADQYRISAIEPEKIDTGALILTGVAVQRHNARTIGDLFAREAGKLVAVSAGDSLETVMSAHGSGAVARSLRDGVPVLNVDIGGGTCKLAYCVDGKIAAHTAVDIGARLIVTDDSGRVVRMEEAGRLFARELGYTIQPGDLLTSAQRGELAELMAARLMETIRGGTPFVAGVPLLRGEPMPADTATTSRCVTISGGVSEYFYGTEGASFGDLGVELAKAFSGSLRSAGIRIELPDQKIRATVIGASQYTTQVSGGTIYFSPPETLPLRNIPVIAPELNLDREEIDPASVATAVRDAIRRLDLADAVTPAAIFVPWRGSATFARLDAFCRGIVDGLADLLKRGLPIILAGDGDVGGLLGMHFHAELGVPHAVVSIDNLELREFDFIDIGKLIDLSGAVPVVIKSLIFNTRVSATRK